MDESTLRQDIVDELEFEPSLNAAHIGVAVERGVVTLTGHVTTYVQKTAAEEAVRRVKGVKGIAQEIEVRPIGANKTADDEIAKRALNSLRWTTLLPQDVVQIRIQDGWVTLTGEVDWHYQRTAAENAVSGLAGVKGLRNNIEVRPNATTADVKKRIEDALKRNAEVEANAIRVEVKDSKVRLEGKVNTWAQRRAAERAASSAPGVRSVEDLLIVS